MKKKAINSRIAKVIASNINRFIDDYDRITWAPMLELVKEEFPNESLTFNRVRAIYRSYLRGTYDKMLKKELRVGKEIPETSESKKDKPIQTKMKREGKEASGTITISSTINPVDLKETEIIKMFDLNPNKWECVSFTTKAWQTSMRDKDREYMQPTNWSVSAKFRIRADFTFEKNDLRDWFYKSAKEAAKKARANIPRNKVAKPNSNSVFIPAIYDLHLGKLSWAGETGENFDLKIGYKRAMRALTSLTDRALEGDGFDEVILVVG